MNYLFRVTAPIGLAVALGLPAAGQTQPPGPRVPAASVQVTPRGGANAPQAARPAANRPMRRSIVEHYPYPYPGYYHGDERAGFRNPGGQGRYLEYYPPGNRFQDEGDPVRVARFDQGGGAPDRAEQMAAQQIGIARDNAIMGHIDSYARPTFGIGYFGGFY